MTQELITELREWRIASAPYEPEYKVPPSDLHLKAADALERLTAERDSLKEGLDGWHARCLDMEVERDAMEEQMTADRKQFLGVRDELNALRARGCIDGLLKRTPVRDVAETLAEIDAAIGEKK
jgi:uncharacterized coiled-coil DUF342 family protein